MTYLVVALLLINVALIILFLKPLLASGGKPSDTNREGQLVHDTATAQTEKELQEMADRLLDRMDRKIDVLKKLLDQADERIASIATAQKAMPKQEPRRKGLGPEDFKKMTKSEKHAAIARLFHEGMSKEEIARTTRAGMAEVDLIVNMEKRAGKRSGT